LSLTERDNGQTRALQPQELFASQHYATSVYRSELAMRLQGLGYELELGKHGQPETKGYTREYLEASSPRREQIKDHLRERKRIRSNSMSPRLAASTSKNASGCWSTATGRGVRTRHWCAV
jgi:conjugative relaxase-like TrwC/TraI family protein